MSYKRAISRIIKLSVRNTFEHRSNFYLNVFLQVINYGFLILFIEIIFSRVDAIAGWSLDEMQLLGVVAQSSAILYSVFFAGGISRLQESVRTGGFDFFLLKPLDAQVHCSLSRINPLGLSALLGPVIWILYLVVHRNLELSLVLLPIGFLLLCSGVVLRYSFGIGTAVLSFLLTKVSALQSLQSAMMNQSHFPISMYTGWIKVFAVYMVPLALLANSPALLLINGEPDLIHYLLLAFSAFSVVVTRYLYATLVKRYTSASS